MLVAVMVGSLGVLDANLAMGSRLAGHAGDVF